MSAENVEVIREASEALENEGVEALMRYIHPDFEFTTPPELASEPGTYRGAEGLRRYFDSFYDAMDEVHFVPDEFIDAGDTYVIVPTTLRARGRSTGIEVEQKVVLVWTFRDGKVISNQPFATLDEARASVGLEPVEAPAGE